jgi:hypothetical protein
LEPGLRGPFVGKGEEAAAPPCAFAPVAVFFEKDFVSSGRIAIFMVIFDFRE